MGASASLTSPEAPPSSPPTALTAPGSDALAPPPGAEPVAPPVPAPGVAAATVPPGAPTAGPVPPGSAGADPGPPGRGTPAPEPRPRARTVVRAPSRDTSPSSRGNSSVSVTRTSGPKSVESAGRARPVWSETTSRSTPVSCSAISWAEANLRAGSGSVARTSSR